MLSEAKIVTVSEMVLLYFKRNLNSNNIYLAVFVKEDEHDEVDDEQFYVENIFTQEKRWLDVNDCVVKTMVDPDCDRFRALARGEDLVKVILGSDTGGLSGFNIRYAHIYGFIYGLILTHVRQQPSLRC